MQSYGRDWPVMSAQCSESCADRCGKQHLGHCNEHAKTCVLQPGTHGDGCNKLSLFDTPASLLSDFSSLPPAWRRLNFPNTGSRQVICQGVTETVRKMQLRLTVWNASKRKKSRYCFRGARGLCSGRGVCMHGWCSCREPGAFGPDCAHGVHPIPPDPDGLAIYVYELPPDLGFTYGRHVNPNYMAETRFIGRLLRDWSVRTLNPERADLYLIPMFSVRGPATNSYCDRARVELITQHVRSRYPFWNRSNGKDHVIWSTLDRGGCGLSHSGAQPIIISHWGLLGPFAATKHLAEARSGPATAYFRESTGGGLSQSDRALMEKGLSSGEWCFAPHKDIVVPPYYRNAHKPLPSPSRPSEHLLVHAGGIWGPNNIGPPGIVTYYSLGMRQRLFLVCWP